MIDLLMERTKMIDLNIEAHRKIVVGDDQVEDRRY